MARAAPNLDGTSFWTYEKELPVKHTNIAVELIGTKKFITSPGLVLLEREGRFGGYGGAQRGSSGGADVDALDRPWKLRRTKLLDCPRICL
jgi:hypothetical protein